MVWDMEWGQLWEKEHHELIKSNCSRKENKDKVSFAAVNQKVGKERF